MSAQQRHAALVNARHRANHAVNAANHGHGTHDEATRQLAAFQRAWQQAGCPVAHS